MNNAAVRPKQILLILAAFIAALILVPVINGQPLLAQDEAETACMGIEAAGGDCSGGDDDLSGVIRAVINILLYIVGVASVIVLVVGGLRYVLSGGDQQAVASAKNTIIYAIIGLVVAVMAFAAVEFVFDLISTGGSGGASSPPQTTCPPGQDCPI